MLDSGRIVAVTADGRNGFEPDAPYDAIHVGAAADSWRVVDRLVAQLKNGGRLFVPVHDTDADADADADLVARALPGPGERCYPYGSEYNYVARCGKPSSCGSSGFLVRSSLPPSLPPSH